MTAVVPPLALIWIEAAQSRSDDLSNLQVPQVGGAKFSAEATKRVKRCWDVRRSKYTGWRKAW